MSQQAFAIETKENVRNNKKIVRQTRRTFSRSFKVRCVKEVLGGEKTLHDFIGRDGRPIYYGNVDIWVNEYLAGKWGKVQKNLVPAKAVAKKTKPPVEDTSGTDFKDIAFALAASIRKTHDLEVANERLRARAAGPRFNQEGLENRTLS